MHGTRVVLHEQDLELGECQKHPAMTTLAKSNDNKRHLPSGMELRRLGQLLRYKKANQSNRRANGEWMGNLLYCSLLFFLDAWKVNGQNENEEGVDREERKADG